MRRVTALVTVVPLTAAMLTATAPDVLAAAKKTTSVTYPQTCYSVPDRLAQPRDNTGQDVTVDTTAPETVSTGKLFKVSIQIKPNKVHLANLPLGAKVTSNSRFKFDLAMPDGFEFVAADLDESDANLKGFSVYTVNESGEKDPNGRILRMASADNATIGNSPNSSTDQPASVLYDVNGQDFIFLKVPRINLRFKAAKPGTWSLGVRNAGVASEHGAHPENYLTFLATTTTPLGAVYAPTYCTPRKDPSTPFDDVASRLTSVTIVDPGASPAQPPAPGDGGQPEPVPSPEPVPQAPAAKTSLSVAVSDATAGSMGHVTATVSPSQARGRVTFAAGAASATAVVSGGKADADVFFADAGSTPVTATFVPDDAAAFTPATATTTVVVKPAAASLTLSAPDSVANGSRFTASAFVPVGAEGTVTFTFGEKTVTKTVADGVAIATIDAGTTAQTTLLSAVFTPAAGSSLTSASAERNVTVREKQSTTVPQSRVELTGPTAAVGVGSTATFTATVTGAAGAVAPAGVIVFQEDASTGDVTGGGSMARTVPLESTGTSTASATIQWPAVRGGNHTMTAFYVPSSAGQTRAVTDPYGFIVTAPKPTQLTIAPVVDAVGLKPAAVAVQVSPKVDGTITATINGRTTTAAVNNGGATINVTAPDKGTFDVHYTFTPADPSQATPVDMSSTITASQPVHPPLPPEPPAANPPAGGTQTPGASDDDDTADLEDLVLNATIPETAAADTPIVIPVTVADFDGLTRGVNGTVSITNNSVPVTADGKDITLPIRDGHGTLTLTFKGGGPQALSLAFFDANGKRLTGLNKTVTITGGVAPTPVDKPTEDTGIIAMIIKFFTQLFSSFNGGSSS